MAELIKGIYIHTNPHLKGAPVEECEKVEQGYVIRYQRRTDVSLGKQFLRFFSDLFNGVTKAQGRLCNAFEKLPDTIYVRGHALPIKSQSDKSAVGNSTSHEKSWPKAFEEIDIFFRIDSADASKQTDQNNSIDEPTSTANETVAKAKTPPPLPSRDRRPKLQTVTDSQAPSPALDGSAKPASVTLPPPPKSLTPEAVAAMTAEEKIPTAPPPPLTAKAAAAMTTQRAVETHPGPAITLEQAAPAQSPPPATVLPAESLIKKSSPDTAPGVTERPSSEMLENARQGLKKTTQNIGAHTGRSAGKVDDPNDLTTILKNKFASRRIVINGEAPENSNDSASEWDK